MDGQSPEYDLVLAVGGGVLLAIAAVIVAYLKWRTPKE